MIDQQKKQFPVLVSIVIPAYNVQAYIDQCMDSMVKQTYQNIEILLINDGSTDHTLELCKKWEQSDHRIRLICQKNQGLGPTRNVGINEARGKYICFVDSDDWLREDAIEKLVDLAEETGADVTVFDFTEVDNVTRDSRQRHLQYRNHQVIETDADKGVFLFLGWVMACGKLYRTDFMKKNQIYMPALRHEDNAIFPMVALLANRIVYLAECFYFYRVNRQGSIISSKESRVDLPKACCTYLNYFKERNLWNKWEAVLKRYFDTKIWFAREMLQTDNQKDLLKQMNSYTDEVYKMYFPGKKKLWEYSFVLLGGFGSRYIVQQLGVKELQLIKHYPFSSLICMMSADNEQYGIFNDNQFRVDCIRNDITGEVKKSLQGDGPEADFLFVDFMEERFNILQLENGNYITKSDAYEDSRVAGLSIKREIALDSEEFFDLWKAACKEFISLLKKYSPNTKIVLLKMRMALQYKQEQKITFYSNREEIIKMDSLHKRMEEFFAREYGAGLKEYETPATPYSDEKFKFGCEPQYLNYIQYKQMYMQIRTTLEEGV